MADDVEMMPVDAAEPPKTDPLSATAAPKVATLKLNPVPRKPVLGGTVTASLKPGLKLPPKPGMATGLKLPPKPTTAAALKPGLKLPTVALKPGLKLPAKPVVQKPGATVVTSPLPKPVAAPQEEPKPALAVAAPVVPAAESPVAALKPGLKLPTAPLKPGLKLPPKPVIRKPGSTVTAAPLPKPVTPLPKPVVPTADAKQGEVPAVPIAKPVAVDAQGVGKLPTVAAKAVDRSETAPVVSANPNPLEALKSATQKLKGITQEIPQQAILRKTGIIAEGAMSEAQKEASKHKTARISLSDAMGVAPVKNENAPMKTIRIKRPVDISGVTKSLTPVTSASSAETESGTADATAPAAVPVAPTVTQRKTLKISRPGGAVRPAGKFGVKRPGQATAVARPPAAGEEAVASAAGETPVADIADIPELPSSSAPAAVAPASEGPAWLMTLSTLVQAAACVAIGALAWLLYQNSQTSYF